jgi:hypothetical protein
MERFKDLKISKFKDLKIGKCSKKITGMEMYRRFF